MKKNLTIVFSNHCNMDIYGGCSYCCIQKRGSSPVLDLDTVLRKIKEIGVENIEILEYFGGEPTLHFYEISTLIKMFPNIKHRMYTNGLFDFLQWKDYLPFFYEICFSQDGPDSFNGKRGVKNNSFVSIQCLENIKKTLLLTENVTIAIVPSTVSHFDKLDFIFEYYKNIGIRSFSLEIPSIIQDSFINKKFTDVEFLKILDFFYNTVVSDFLKDDESKILFNIPKEFSSIQINSSPCSDTNIAISPSGKISHCRDTAANEESLISNGSILKYYDIKKIKEIEKNNTCHFKKIQGYDNSISVNNKILPIVQLMYSTISLLNFYYLNFINSTEKSQLKTADETLNLIRSHLFYYSSYRDSLCH